MKILLFLLILSVLLIFSCDSSSKKKETQSDQPIQKSNVPASLTVSAFYNIDHTKESFSIYKHGICIGLTFKNDKGDLIKPPGEAKIAISETRFNTDVLLFETIVQVNKESMYDDKFIGQGLFTIHVVRAVLGPFTYDKFKRDPQELQNRVSVIFKPIGGEPILGETYADSFIKLMRN